MELHEVVRMVVIENHPKELAEKMAMNLSSLYRWGQPRSEEFVSPPLRTAEFLQCVRPDDRLIAGLCQCAGGFYMPNPLPASSPPEFIVAHAQTMKAVVAFQEVMVEVEVFKGHSPELAQRLREQLERLKSRAESFTQCYERGIAHL